MAKYRIKCSKCDWKTNPYFLQTDCLREKERSHMAGLILQPDKTAHDAAFGDYCPKCGSKTVTEHRYFDSGKEEQE